MFIYLFPTKGVSRLFQTKALLRQILIRANSALISWKQWRKYCDGTFSFSARAAARMGACNQLVKQVIGNLFSL